eukprot:9968061-Ditylum_brightwellii.AAC.1
MSENIISKLLYAGTYHDDGLKIFNGQRTVDEVADGAFFQYTAEVWKPQAANNLPSLKRRRKPLEECCWKNGRNGRSVPR